MIVCLIITIIIFLYLWYLEYKNEKFIDENLQNTVEKTFKIGYFIGLTSTIIAILIILMIKI